MLALWLLVVAVCPAGSQTSAPLAPGTLVEVGGHRIHFLCSGSGSPTVVVENGLGDFSTDWSLVQSRVAKFTRICTYDRAGYAWSEPGPMPRTFDQLNLELHEGLKLLGEHPPFVLVGHSFGGPVIRHYAQIYRGDVSGMVLVDTPHEDQRIPMGSVARRIRDSATLRKIPAPRLQMNSDETTLSKMAAPSTDPLDADHMKLPKENQAIDLWARAQPALEAAEDSQKDWSSEYMDLMHDSEQKGILGVIPLIVLTRKKSGYDDNLDVPAVRLDEERLATQRALAELSSNSIQLIVPCGHQMHLQAPAIVAAFIERVALAARSGRLLADAKSTAP